MFYGLFLPSQLPHPRRGRGPAGADHRTDLAAPQHADSLSHGQRTPDATRTPGGVPHWGRTVWPKKNVLFYRSPSSSYPPGNGDICNIVFSFNDEMIVDSAMKMIQAIFHGYVGFPEGRKLGLGAADL